MWKYYNKTKIQTSWTIFSSELFSTIVSPSRWCSSSSKVIFEIFSRLYVKEPIEEYIQIRQSIVVFYFAFHSQLQWCRTFEWKFEKITYTFYTLFRSYRFRYIKFPLKLSCALTHPQDMSYWTELEYHWTDNTFEQWATVNVILILDCE